MYLSWLVTYGYFFSARSFIGGEWYLHVLGGEEIESFLSRCHFVYEKKQQLQNVVNTNSCK